MRSLLSKIGILSVLLGLTLGSAVPVYAKSSKGEHMSERADAHSNRDERLQLRLEQRAGSGSAKSGNDEKDDHAKSQTDSSHQKDASNGTLMSGLRNELNTFGSWLKTQLHDAKKGIAALSVQARAKLYSDILAKIHSALLALRTDISATITAAVGSSSSSSSSSVSSSSSSSSTSSSSSSSSSLSSSSSSSVSSSSSSV